MFTVYLASENAILLFVMGWVVVASVLPRRKCLQ